MLIAGALKNAILNSARFSIIATDEKGIIQLFNVGAEYGVIDFFADFLAGAFFFAAIKLTTFHAVRDLTVAPTWQKTPDLSGQLFFG